MQKVLYAFFNVKVHFTKVWMDQVKSEEIQHLICGVVVVTLMVRVVGPLHLMVEGTVRGYQRDQ